VGAHPRKREHKRGFSTFTGGAGVMRRSGGRWKCSGRTKVSLLRVRPHDVNDRSGPPQERPCNYDWPPDFGQCVSSPCISSSTEKEEKGRRTH
jgi:hypothetical protein